MSLRLPYASRSLPFQSLPCLMSLRQSNSRISFSAGSRTVIRASAIPARDRIIDFGKHKGKMLGTIPSGYLKWVTENVDSVWAKLADQVLKDPIYQDRIEWEFAYDILSGEKLTGNMNAAEEVFAIAERFGWDFEDDAGWRKVNLPLLGTTEGGRIPRISDRTSNIDEKTQMKKVAAKDLAGGERRRDRIERQRVKREIGKLQDKKLELGIEPGTTTKGKSRPRSAAGKDADAAAAQPPRLALTDDGDDRHYRQDQTAKSTRSPFPGREAFLKKVLDREKPL